MGNFKWKKHAYISIKNYHCESFPLKTKRVKQVSFTISNKYKICDCFLSNHTKYMLTQGRIQQSRKFCLFMTAIDRYRKKLPLANKILLIF